MDEHNIRRHEAFSDIVIGFSLAQLGLLLQIPQHGSDLFTDPVWLFGFALAFANVCALWWFHHRLFSTMWTARPLPVLLNFAWLATFVLCIYATQAVYRLGLDPDAFRFYFMMFALTYGLLTLQYSICRRERSGTLDALAILRGERQMSMMALWTLNFVIVWLMWSPWTVERLAPFTFAPFLASAILSSVLARRYRVQEARLSVPGQEQEQG